MAGPRAHPAAVGHCLGTEGSAGRLEFRACPQRKEAVPRAQGGGGRRGQGTAWGLYFPDWARRGAGKTPRGGRKPPSARPPCARPERLLESRVRPDVPQVFSPAERVRRRAGEVREDRGRRRREGASRLLPDP